MEVTVEELSPVKKKINVAIPPETVEEEIASTYQKLKQTVTIRGFRPGKVPRDLLKKYYKEHVEGEVITRLIQETYPEALKKVQIVPVSQPVVENGVLEEGREFTYSASFEVKPEVELKEYLNLPVERERVNITQQDVEKRLSMLRELHASLKEVEEDRPVGKGDFIVVDITGTLMGKPFEGGDVKDTFLPGLGQKLVGLKKGAFEELTLSIPDDYHRKELAGQEVVLKIKVKGIKERILPELDDAFARDLGEEEGLESLKEKLRNELEKEELRRVNSSLKSMLIDQLIEKNPLEAPAYMVERQIEFMLADTQRALLAQGSSLDKLGVSLDAMKERYRKEAEKQVKFSLLVEVISEKEGITISDNEVEEKIEEIAKSSNQEVAKVREFYQKEGLWGGLKIKLLEEKTLDFLIERAAVTEVDKQDK